MKPYWVLLLAATACGNSYRTKTHSFVATDACGQGPFDVVLPAEATTGGEGMEVIACTPRRLAGHVELTVGGMPLRSKPFGDVADNQRCLGGQPVVVTEGTGAAQSTTAGDSGRSVQVTSTNLAERPFIGSETPFADDLCKDYGLTAQVIMGVTTLSRADDVWLKPGDPLHVRIWSDVPNDLEGVFFMVRQVVDNDTVEHVAKEQKKDQEKWEREEREGKHTHVAEAAPVAPAPIAPPPPLVEERPAPPSARATWISGYWVRTGERWGWIAGFWRDERFTPMRPQVEIPGEPPHAGAVWIGGNWTIRAGANVWVRGRWR